MRLWELLNLGNLNAPGGGGLWSAMAVNRIACFEHVNHSAAQRIPCGALSMGRGRMSRLILTASSRPRFSPRKEAFMTEIIFEVTEDEVDGGYSASALGYGIHTQGDSVEEIRSNVKEAVACYFDDTMPRPKLIRLHFVRDEVVVA